MPRRSEIFREVLPRPRRRRARRAYVFENEDRAGLLEETPRGYRFTYDPVYLLDPRTPPSSLTLPKRAASYQSRHLFPFFIGLLAEGSLKDLQCRILKIDEDDYFGRLVLTAGGDVIGSVRVRPAEEY